MKIVPPHKPVVHIVDDDRAVQEGLSNLLRSASFSVASFFSPKEFLDSWQRSSHGCVILDIRFPDESGLDCQARFQRLEMTMPVILMTGHADVPSSVKGMKAGAVDFLTKPFDDRSILDAIATAFERDATRFRNECGSSRLFERYATLTHREKEVFALVTQGLMNKQIAGQLDLSEITVKVHRGTMMRKMNVRTVADLVRASEALKNVPDAFVAYQSAKGRAELYSSVRSDR